MEDKIREEFEKHKKEGKQDNFIEGRFSYEWGLWHASWTACTKSRDKEIEHLKALIDHQVKGHDIQRAEIKKLRDALEDRKSCKGCKYEPELECTAECSRHIYDDMFKGW